MSEEIHEHDVHDIRGIDHEHEGFSMEFLMGLVLLIIALFLLFYYLIPSLRAPQVNIPGRIDINLRQTK